MGLLALRNFDQKQRIQHAQSYTEKDLNYTDSFLDFS